MNYKPKHPRRCNNKSLSRLNQLSLRHLKLSKLNKGKSNLCKSGWAVKTLSPKVWLIMDVGHACHKMRKTNTFFLSIMSK